MIKIISKYNDKTPLDVLATECDYEVVIFELDGAVTSALCEGDTSGEQARNEVDKYRLLADANTPFPNTLTFIHSHISQFVNSLGL